MLSVTFDVNHKVLDRGVYLAKLDRMQGVCAVTLDIRLRRPYREPVMTEVEMHTFEHSYATAIRQQMDGKEGASVVYFGPMGGNTGFYLVFQVAAPTEEALEQAVERLPFEMDAAIDLLFAMKETPAANEWQCGNCYSLGDASVSRRMGEELRQLLSQVKETGYSQYVRLSEEELAALGIQQ